MFNVVRSDGRTETCGLYLVTKPDQLLEITLHQIDVDCDSGLVVVGMHEKQVTEHRQYKLKLRFLMAGNSMAMCFLGMTIILLM